MNQEPRIITPDQFTRRSFLQRGSAALGGAALVGALSPARFALGVSGGDEIKLAIVGCGGRGSGAANQALCTSNLGPVKLVAAADVHEDRMNSSLKNLQKQHGDRVDVPKERQFVGFDAYKKAIDCASISSFSPRLPASARCSSRPPCKPASTSSWRSRSPSTRRACATCWPRSRKRRRRTSKVGVGLQRHHQSRLPRNDASACTTARSATSLDARLLERPAPVAEEARRSREAARPATDRDGVPDAQLVLLHLALRRSHLRAAHPQPRRHQLGEERATRSRPAAWAAARSTYGGSDDGEIYDHLAVEFEYADGSIVQRVPPPARLLEQRQRTWAQGTKGRVEHHRLRDRR